jgi:cytochrome c556
LTKSRRLCVNEQRGPIHKGLAITAEPRNLITSPQKEHTYPMKFKALLTLALAAFIGINVAIAGEDDTPLGKQMKQMNKALRTLKKQATDAAKKDENLALIAGIKKNVEESAKLEPAETKKVPAAEKAAYLDKYKAQMSDLAKTYDQLEAAIKGDKADDVKKALEKLGDEKEKGHKDFAPDEK